MEMKVMVKVTDANGKETKEWIPQQDSNHFKELMVNIFWSIMKLDMLYSFHKQNKIKELI